MSDDYWPECNGDHGYFEDQMEKLRARLAEVERERDDARRLHSEAEEQSTIQRDRAKRAEAERDEAQAKADVRGGEWCAQNRAEGRGPCGACAWCCASLRDRAERAEAELKRLRAVVEAAREARKRCSAYTTHNVPIDAISFAFIFDRLDEALAALDAKG